MRASELKKMRTRLQQRRRAVLERSHRASAAIDQLRVAERDPEAAEASQSEQVQYDLTQLGEVEQQEIAQIDATLERLEAGEYGICRDCRQRIDTRRLAAVPYALDCAECAGRREKARALDREAAKRPRPMIPESE